MTVCQRLHLLSVVLLGTACGESTKAGTELPVVRAAKLVLTSSPVSVVNRVPFSTQPVVQLVDANGRFVAQSGTQIAATMSSGGGVLSGAVAAVTDASGKAAFTDLQIAGAVGARTLEFAATGLASVNATVTLTAGAASRIAVSAGNQAIAPAGAAVAQPPAVRVVDADGNAVAGTVVSFTVGSGGGTVTGGTATTSAEGIATVGSWRLGAVAGEQTLIATAAGLTGSPVTFVASATVLLDNVSPALAAVAPLARATFAALDQLGGPWPVTWLVNGVPGGSTATGLISSGGEYVAPAVIPEGDTVVITAVSTQDATRRVSAIAYFMPTLAQRDYYVQFPRVMTVGQRTKTRVLWVPPTGVTSITFVERAGCSNPTPPCGGASTPLQSVGNGVLMFELDPTIALSGYRPNSLHNLAGFLDLRDAAGTLTRRTLLGVNVREAQTPDVAITPLASDAQRSAFVLNLRVDAPLLGVAASPSVTSRALQLLGDRFDFLAIVANVTSGNNRFYAGVRNDVRGIGLQQFNNSVGHGSAGRLRGLVHYPSDEYFDPQSALAHEVGHAWISFAVDTLLRVGNPHWPLSDIGNESVMGVSIPGSGAGGFFQYGLVAAGNGLYRLEARSQGGRYTMWDLYLMGLVPRDSVPPALILPRSLSLNAITPGLLTPATTYTIDEYVAAHGARAPAAGASPSEFTIATVVLSYGRLLTPAELSYFDAAAARMESTIPLPLTIGFGVGDSNPFWVVSGGRARLRARLN
ncbi:MAG: hypothetical protein P3B98_04140 [Gemmatimonadota bacterium]|nr:hypothetical protein [Gemmatimonadota bacterium]